MMSSTLSSSPTITAVDPSTGEPGMAFAVAGAAEVEAAVAAAHRAQPAWAATPATERAAALRRVASAIRGHREELARRNAVDSGKLIGDARGGVDAAAATIEQYAELGPLHRGRALDGDRLAFDAMRYEPRGVVAALVPFNDPIAVAGQGLAAALAPGNAVVYKPSERTPSCAALLAELFAAHLPDGVLMLVQGDARTGRPLVAHAGVAVVLHTGTADTGREIARTCAARGAHAVLELGGNDPLIVDEGVDPAWAAEQAASGAFANAGQICVSVERIYVHARLAAPFLEALERRARALRVGPALDAATQLGPLVDERARMSVHAQVAAATAAGAQVVCGGAPIDGPGCFYPATVLTAVTDDMAVMAHETFGPVASVRVVESFDEALALANSSPYGLAATALTCSQQHAARAAAELRVGTVKVNAVWGGAPGGAAHPRGISGSALGYGPELLDELTQVKAVHLEPGVPGPAR
ncbi:aldehyde dehydrogenase family protein [Baekduia sp.]|jgi:succinate-semialdehyde dehydrogenase/glutarate-semialdehyde dehydrogenase|uniref:aldehyde dehydrogenase family protein n=1 Tax=Baekduia sp. TaxID=2600305 RepID=UPI002E0274E3|nr:aldehyde dehydrogenase family protein [Baekduia sp.]